MARAAVAVAEGAAWWILAGTVLAVAIALFALRYGDPDRVDGRPAGHTDRMLWLIIGIILLVIAIAGGAVIHPILFVLAVLALVLFVMHFRAGRV